MPEILRVPVTGPTQERAADSAQVLIDALQKVDDGSTGDTDKVVEAAWRMARGQTRWIVAGRTRSELVTALAEFVLDGTCAQSGRYRSGQRRPTFVFSGMGPQWSLMGRGLATMIAGFSDRIGEIDKLMSEYRGRSVWDELVNYDESDQLPTELAQPGNFLIQAALHDQLVADGIVPEAVVGHSAGEVASAYAAGVYDLPEAARVAVVRGRLQARLAGRGSMLAVGVGEQEALHLIAGLQDVSLAAINDREAVTVAGANAQIAQLEDRLRTDQIFAKRLRVEVPYHSHVMDEIADELATEMAFIVPKPARIPLYSTVSGRLSTGEEWGPSYWPQNVRQPARFAAAIEQALADGSKTFVEVAPHPVLSQSIKAVAPADEAITVTPLLTRRGDEYQTFLGAVAGLALEGIGRPDRGPAAPLPRPRRLPQIMWDQDHWYDADREAAPAKPGIALLGRRVADHGDEFQVEVSIGDQPWIQGHEVHGLGPVVPATMWAELMALAATAGEAGSCSLTDLTIVRGLPVLANPTLVRMELAGGIVRCSSRPIGDSSLWSLNAVAAIGSAVAPSAATAIDRAPATGFGLDADALYALFRLKGLRYSGLFRNLTDVVVGGSSSAADNTSSGPLVAWGTIAGGQPYTAGQRAPWMLDAGLQLLVVAAHDLGEAMYLPYRMGRVALHQPISGDRPLDARADVTSRTDDELVGRVRYFDAAGSLVAELSDVVCMRNRSDDATRAAYVARNTYALHPVSPSRANELDSGLDDHLQLEADSELESELDVEIAALLDPSGSPDAPAPDRLKPVEYWLTDGGDHRVGGEHRVGGGRPAVDFQAVPTGQGAHLLWFVPHGSRTNDAVQTFNTVNRVAALDDPTLTLTLVGRPEQTWLLGLRRSASNAFGLRIRVVLAGAEAADEQLDYWIGEVDEHEVRLDHSVALSRLEQIPAQQLQVYNDPVHRVQTTLAFDLPTASRLQVTAETVMAPGPGEITIDNRAVPLTWKDVGKVLGTIGASTLSTFAGQHLGLGAVGMVVAVGPDVPFVPGDLVAGPIRRPFRQRMTVNVEDEFIRPLPATVDPVTHVALTMPWLTALAALDDVARLQPGERIFVQSGAGALGSVLCRRAITLGCQVVTSVGTSDKVAVVHNLFDEAVDVVVARGDEVPGALLSGGHGRFDCIAAMVSGNARNLLFSQLATRGRYLDLGKPSSADEAQLTAAVDGNRSLVRIDTDRIAAEDPVWFNDLITRATAATADPTNHTPVTRFPLAELPRAITELARGETVGSLAIEIDPGSMAEDAHRVVPSMDPNGVYLITGGYGGVGLMCAQWLASRGAQHIVLAGRLGVASRQGQAVIDMLRAFGIDIWVLAADVADPAATASILAELRAEWPLRGIVHAAGVIADGPFADIDAERVQRSFAAKVDGADNVINGLNNMEGAVDELDFILLTSSMSGALGVSLQATYAAANTGLDGLAEMLRRRGTHACAMQFGPIEEAGMAADDERNARFFAANGLPMIAPRQLFGILDLAASAVAPVVMTAEVDWQRVGRSEPGNARSSVLGPIVARASSGGEQAGIDELLDLDPDSRTEVLTLMLLGLFAEALGIDENSLAADASFADLGMDSLAVVEIQVGISEALQHDVPMARLFMPDGNVGQLASRISGYLDDTIASEAQPLRAGGERGGDMESDDVR